MKLNWIIEEGDIYKIRQFVEQHNNPFVQRRVLRNVNRQGIKIDKNSILENLMMCLLTSQQRS